MTIIIDCWSSGIQSMFVIFGFVGLGIFFAWRNKKVLVVIIALTLGYFAFMTITSCIFGGS